MKSPSMSIHDLSFEDALKQGELDYYKQGMDFFYAELVDLNVNLFILDKVIAFPFNLLVGVEETLFFHMVFRNFFYASLLIITRIAADQGGGLFTLPRFKNRIRQAVKKGFQGQMDDRLREVRFDKKTQKLLERARKLRTQRIAHAVEGVVLGEEQEIRVFHGDLQQLRDQLNDLLDALSFNVENMMLPVQYSPDVIHPEGSDKRPDIELVLDSIAKSSPTLNMPEDHPARWSRRRKQLTSEEMKVINQYREKFGLRAIS